MVESAERDEEQKTEKAAANLKFKRELKVCLVGVILGRIEKKEKKKKRKIGKKMICWGNLMSA